MAGLPEQPVARSPSGTLVLTIVLRRSLPQRGIVPLSDTP